jgi:hypothetical protein
MHVHLVSKKSVIKQWEMKQVIIIIHKNNTNHNTHKINECDAVQVHISTKSH